MSRLPATLQNLPLPVIASPMFIVSNPQLVIEQCKAGVVGSMPALNARPAAQLDEWLHEITETLAAHNRAHPERPQVLVDRQDPVGPPLPGSGRKTPIPHWWRASTGSRPRSDRWEE